MARPGRGPRLVRIRKRGWQQAVYYIRWTEHGRTCERSTGSADLAGAEAAFAAWLAGRDSSMYAAPFVHRGSDGDSHAICRANRPREAAHVRIADVLTAYALEHGRETAAPERIGYAMDALVAWWGDTSVAAVDRQSCRAYAAWAAGTRGAAPGTVRRELGVLRAAVNHARARLTALPEFWLPPPPPRRERWFTRTEAAALLRAARSSPRARRHLPLFILLGLYTGGRKEALLSLRWPQVDLQRGRIDFNPPGRMQTKKRRPVIPIPRRLMRVLEAEQRRAICPYVVHRHGRRLHDVRNAFAAAVARANLAPASPHALRHTCITWLLQRGVTTWQVAGYVGTSEQMITRVYGHHSPDYLTAARAALDA